MNRTRQVAIERHGIPIIGTRGKHDSAHCECCGETVTTFAPEQITDVCRRVHVNRIHLTRTGRSAAMICGNSLQTKQIR